MKFEFKASVVVEADCPETALSDIAWRVATIARHLGGAKALADTAPFFTLTPAADDAVTVDMKHDPIRLAEIAAEKAKADEATPEHKDA